MVYNEKWVDYFTTVIYRDRGASEAAKLGAVASLIRSVTPFSIYSPHTGGQDYQKGKLLVRVRKLWQWWQVRFEMGVVYLFYKGVKKIPTACITVEDAEMMTRMAARGTKIVMNLKMEAKMLPPAISRNTVAEVKGSVYPEQVFYFFL